MAVKQLGKPHNHPGRWLTSASPAKVQLVVNSGSLCITAEPTNTLYNITDRAGQYSLQVKSDFYQFYHTKSIVLALFLRRNCK